MSILSPFSSYDHAKCLLLSLNIWPKMRKIESSPDDPKMSLSVSKSKIHHTYTTSTDGSQIFLRFALRSFVFQIIEVFGFFIGYNIEFEIFEK